MKEKAFIIKLFCFVFCSFIGIYVFNMYIDPYKIFGPNKINEHMIPDPRLLKYEELENSKNSFEFFILGSSRAWNFDPPVIEKIIKLKAFNYAIAGAFLEDYMAIFNQIVHTQKAKTIYLQLDFYTLNERLRNRHILKNPLERYMPSILEPNELSPTEYYYIDERYFSLKAFRDSLKFFRAYLFKKSSRAHSPNEPKQRLMAQSRKVVRLHSGYFGNKYSMYSNFHINEARINKWFGIIKELAEKNGIKLIVALSPMNEEHLNKLLLNKELVNKWFQAKKLIANVFGSFHDFNNCSVHAFKDVSYWKDSVHQTKKLTKIMIDVILRQQIDKDIPNSFGIQVTRNTIDDYLLNLNDLCKEKN